jgi:hypothetical protein
MSEPKWNTPDWNLGFWAGVLFGLYLALGLVDNVFHASAEVKRWIGISGIIGSLIVIQVRHWRFRSKKPPASTHPSPTTDAEGLVGRSGP